MGQTLAHLRLQQTLMVIGTVLSCHTKSIYGSYSLLTLLAGTAAGKFFIQASNDFGLPDDESDDRVNSENLITNWATIEERSVGSTDVDNLFQLSEIGYRWVRVFYDSTSGTATINSFRANFKGY
jgi:hypothetical protein